MHSLMAERCPDHTITMHYIVIYQNTTNKLKKAFNTSDPAYLDRRLFDKYPNALLNRIEVIEIPNTQGVNDRIGKMNAAFYLEAFYT